MGRSADAAGGALRRAVAGRDAAGAACDGTPGISRRWTLIGRSPTCRRGAPSTSCSGRCGRRRRRDLAGEVAGRPAGPLLCEQVAGAGGNPLFVIELVRALDEDGALEVPDGRAETRRVSLPPTLAAHDPAPVEPAVRGRVERATGGVDLGSTFSVTELALVTGRTVAELLPALGAAGEAGLLAESGDRLSFRHDLVRDAIYHDLPSAVRKGLHREAAAMLGGAGAPVERVATHLVARRRARRHRSGGVAATGGAHA